MFNPFKKKPFEIDDFAKLVMTEARKSGIAESLEYDPKSLVLKRGDQRTNLVNLFNDYSQANDVKAWLFFEFRDRVISKPGKTDFVQLIE